MLPSDEENAAAHAGMTSPRLCLNYHDAVLYSTDIDILRSTNSWLNDSCIHYQMTRYQQELHNIEGDRFLFMDPSIVSYLMHQCFSADELLEFRNGQRLYGFQKCRKDQVSSQENSVHVKKVLFLPINDTNGLSDMSDFTSAVGTHWSLLMVIVLLVTRQKDHNEDFFLPIYLHFDSMEKSNNYSSAVAVARKIHLVLSLETSSNNKSSNRIRPVQGRNTATAVDRKDIIIRNCKTPQQLNSWDCGIHMLNATDILATALTNVGTGRGVNTSRVEQLLLLESSNREEIFRRQIADQLTCDLEKILQSSKMATQQKTFASEMRSEMLNSITVLINNFSEKEVKESRKQNK